MKNRILMVMALSFTMIGFAQKNEIKAAEKALKGGDTATAKTSFGDESVHRQFNGRFGEFCCNG